MNIIIIIPARYNSERLPGKPLLKINQKTIIKHVFEKAQKNKFNADIYVTTDDDRIINEIGNENCIKVEENCLNGTERIYYALKKISKKYDIVVNIQGDEPFINPDNINFLIEKFLQNINEKNMVCTTLHNKLNSDSVIDRNIPKLILDNNNNILYCSRSVIPGNKTGNFQKKYYLQHIGVFVFRYEYINTYFDTVNTECMLEEDIEWLKILESGYKVKSFEIKGNHEIGINTKDDYEYLLKKYQIN